VCSTTVAFALQGFRAYQLYSSSESAFSVYIAITQVELVVHSVHCYDDKWSGWFTVYTTTTTMISGVGGSVILNMEQFKFQQQSNCLDYGMYQLLCECRVKLR